MTDIPDFATFLRGRVFVKNQRPGGNPWLPGEIIEITGPVSYRVQLSDGTARQTHQDYLRKRSCEANPHEVSQDQSSSTTTVETSPTASVRRYPVTYLPFKGGGM